MDTESSALVRVPKLLSSDRGIWISFAAMVVGLIGVAVWAVVTQPLLNAVIGVLVVVVGGLLLLGLVLRRHELDTAEGSLVRAWGPGFGRRLRWQEAKVQVVHNRGGQVVLSVRPRSGGRAMHIPLLADDLGGARSQDPALLRVLADQLDAGGHAGEARRLRAQAEHLDAGGPIQTSPLHRLIATPT